MSEEGDRKPTSALTESSNGNGIANSSSSSSTTRQRKKRKWDQPAEAFASILPLAGVAGAGLPGVLTAFARVFPAVPTIAEATPTVSVHQNATTIIQKINQDLATKGLIPQPKIQDEVIAREIVINDAEPGIRYKLTKRQTQEEVQKKTGAVVITRGRYKPPNGPVDQEKPLYLHISAGSHLMETVDRIKAVDHAAAIVEEMLRQSRQNSQLSAAGMPISSLTAAVYVGLEADNSNILISRIRGPNDQYINHIMNETGATVTLRGRGSTTSQISYEEMLQALHLFISADNPKSLDDARSLAENLVETIRSEFPDSRPSLPLQSAASSNLSQPSTTTTAIAIPPLISSQPMAAFVPGSLGAYYPLAMPQLSSQATSPFIGSAASIGASSSTNRFPLPHVYNAVPPPKEQMTEDAQPQGSPTNIESSLTSFTQCMSSPSFAVSCSNTPPALAFGASSNQATIPYRQGQTLGSTTFPQASHIHLTCSDSASVTNYSAYSGIYPQATPLKQVALALQQRPTVPVPGNLSYVKENFSKGQREKQERQRRKFQEFPVSKNQDNQVGPCRSNEGISASEQISNKSREMALPPTKSTTPSQSSPSTLPQIAEAPSTTAASVVMVEDAIKSVSTCQTSDAKLPTLVQVHNAGVKGFKLVEYGEDDDDDDDE